MARRGPFILLLVALTGCLGSPIRGNEPPDPYPARTDVFTAKADGVSVREPNCTAGGCTEFFHIHLAGSENVTQIKGNPAQHGTCSRPWRFDSFPANETISYNATIYEIDRRNLRAVITENMWGVTITGKRYVDGCPTLYGLHPSYPTAQNPYPKRNTFVTHFGSVRIQAFRDGTLAYGEGDNLTLVALGEKLIVSYARVINEFEASFYVQGGFEIVNLGPWPLANLVPGSAPAVTRGQG